MVNWLHLENLWWCCPNICFSVLIHPFLSINIFKKGMFVCRIFLSFCCFGVLFTKHEGANFAWACLITLSNGFYKNLLPIRSPFPGKRQNWILLFYQSGRTSTHIEIFLPICSGGSVAHCFNLLHKVRYRTTKRTASNRWQKFESSCNQSVFNFLFLYHVHMFSFSFFIC